MKNRILTTLLLLIIISVSGFSQSASVTITYNGAQGMGCCNMCGQDYWCINSTGGCGSSAACDTKNFFDSIPSGNIITGVSVTYFGGGCYSASVASLINGVALITTATDTTCICGTCMVYSSGVASFSCPAGLPDYNYNGINTFTCCPDAGFCPQRVVITFTYAPLPIANAGADNIICSGDTAILSGAGGISYLWTDFINSYTTATISVNPATSTLYAFTVTDGAGCIASDTVLVSVTPSKDIFGHVSYSGGDVAIGNVVLYKYQSFQTLFDTIQVSSLDGSGNYHFDSINHGIYLIKVFADTVIYPTLVSTYYGNAYLWNDPFAIIINHNCTLNDTLTDITMIESIGTGGGLGLLSGQIIQGTGFGRNEGEPIPGVDVKLGKNPGGIIMGSTASDVMGVYAFSGIDTGNYTVYIDIPGLGRDSSSTFTVDNFNNQFLHLDYIVDSTTIYVNPYFGNGINTFDIAGENKFRVYPNPLKGNTTIEYSLPEGGKITLDVYNVIGVKIGSIVNAYQQSGNYKYNLNPQSPAWCMNSGVYFITLTIDGKTNKRQIIVME